MQERKLSEISNLQRETKVESETWTCLASSKDSGITCTVFFNNVFGRKLVGTSFIAVVTLTDNFTKVTTAAQWCGG